MRRVNLRTFFHNSAQLFKGIGREMCTALTGLETGNFQYQTWNMYKVKKLWIEKKQLVHLCTWYNWLQLTSIHCQAALIYNLRDISIASHLHHQQNLGNIHLWGKEGADKGKKEMGEKQIKVGRKRVGEWKGKTRGKVTLERRGYSQIKREKERQNERDRNKTVQKCREEEWEFKPCSVLAAVQQSAANANDYVQSNYLIKYSWLCSLSPPLTLLITHGIGQRS